MQKVGPFSRIDALRWAESSQLKRIYFAIYLKIELPTLQTLMMKKKKKKKKFPQKHGQEIPLSLAYTPTCRISVSLSLSVSRINSPTYRSRSLHLHIDTRSRMEISAAANKLHVGSLY